MVIPMKALSAKEMDLRAIRGGKTADLKINLMWQARLKEVTRLHVGL